jgi:chromosome segregation ATPase
MSNPKNLSLSDANQALQDVAAAVEELEAECYRLRAELKTSNAERDELRQQVENIKNGFEGSCYACEPVGEMNKKLLKERDEARREVCKSAGILRSVLDPNQEVDEWANYIAKVNNWDCFKDSVPLKRKTLSESDPRIISIDELEQTIRNSQMYD